MELEDIHKACRECKRESASKPYNITPPNLLLIAPEEELSINFMAYGTQDMLVIKDRHSVFIAAKLTKDKTISSAVTALRK